MKILFVCTGNICRSPMAEVIFRNLCIANGRDDVHCCGAGTSAAEGMPMTFQAYEALRQCGEAVTNEMAASVFRPSMIREFDLIVCMTERHKQDVLGDAGFEAGGCSPFGKCEECKGAKVGEGGVMADVRSRLGSVEKSACGNVRTLDEFAGCGDVLDPFLCSLDVYISVCKLLQNSLKVLYNTLFGN